MPGPTFPGYTAAVPCRRDGYTRVNAFPSGVVLPSPEPTPAPVGPTYGFDTSFCCPDYNYGLTDYRNCENAMSFTAAPISCATCAAYQCMDWSVGSSYHAAREAAFFAQTGSKVYFTVGAYGDASNAGLCYRMNVTSLDRDVIFQVVEFGAAVSEGSVTIQVADGGFGPEHACTHESTFLPMFNGSEAVWGVSGERDPPPPPPHCCNTLQCCRTCTAA